MHGRPDVIKELNLNNRLQAPRSHTYCSTDNVCFSEWRVKYPFTAELSLQVCSDFEDATLAFNGFQVFLTRAIGHVFAKYDNARIAFHLCMQTAIDQINHCSRSTC